MNSHNLHLKEQSRMWAQQILNNTLIVIMIKIVVQMVKNKVTQRNLKI